jgi:hypothetical protein
MSQNMIGMSFHPTAPNATKAIRFLITESHS